MPPSCRLDDEGDTVTEAPGTGAAGLTVIVADAVCPSLLAVIVALPAAIAVTSPDVVTVLTPVLLELQLIDRPVRTLLFASSVTADSCLVDPICKVALVGETVTEATGIGEGALTVKFADAEMPALEAESAVVPGAIAETSPLADMVATAALLLLHV